MASVKVRFKNICLLKMLINCIRNARKVAFLLMIISIKERNALAVGLTSSSVTLAIMLVALGVK